MISRIGEDERQKSIIFARIEMKFSLVPNDMRTKSRAADLLVSEYNKLVKLSETLKKVNKSNLIG